MVAKPRKKKSIARPVHFETTIPVLRSCRACGVWLAAGVAEGLKAEIEFVALDPGQQIWAITQGIQMYCMRRSGLVHMDSSRLQQPLGSVYPQHRCHVKWPIPNTPNRFELPRDAQVPPY